MKKITVISEPAEGVAGKTGSWRLKRPVIDNARCIRCLICWIYCPDDTISIKEDGSVSVDYDYCKGCGICAQECPVKAITMMEEE
ncbi:MAG: 4Fe-4S binding protein [Nitrososphaeria archaeon]